MLQGERVGSAGPPQAWRGEQPGCGRVGGEEEAGGEPVVLSPLEAVLSGRPLVSLRK